MEERRESGGSRRRMGLAGGCRGRGRKPRAKGSRWSLEAGKGKGVHSPLEPPKRMQPCGHLDFGPGRPISDLDLEISKKIHLCGPKSRTRSSFTAATKTGSRPRPPMPRIAPGGHFFHDRRIELDCDCKPHTFYQKRHIKCFYYYYYFGFILSEA